MVNKEKNVCQFKDNTIVFPQNFTDDLTCLKPHRGDIFVAAGEKNVESSVGAAFNINLCNKMDKQNVTPTGFFYFAAYAATKISLLWSCT